VSVELGASNYAAAQSLDAVTVSIRIPITEVPAGAPLLRMPLVTSNVKTSADSLADLRAHDAEGALTLSYQDDPSGPKPYRRWVATRPVRGPIEVSYRAPITNISNPLGAAPPLELRSEGPVFSGVSASFLILPDHDKPYRLKLDWKLAALGPKALGVSTLGVGDAVAASAAPSQAWESVFVMGGQLHHEPDVPSPNGFFSAWQGKPPFDPRSLMKWTHQLYEHYLKFFKTPNATYTVYLRRNPINAGGGVALPNSFVGTFDQHTDVDRFKLTLAHEMAHTFIGGLDAANGLADSWFGEGLAVYYARVLAYRAGKISRADYLVDLNSTAARYYTNILNTTPNAEIPARFWPDTRVRVLPYDRGALYFAQLNDEIAIASGGKRSLDDVLMAFLGRRLEGKALTQEAWLDTVVKEVGDKGRRQFEAMMRGEPITLRSQAFGPCFRSAEVPLRRYELGFTPDVLIEPRRIVRGLKPGSAADKAGIRNGDEILKPVPQDQVQAEQRATLTFVISRGGQVREVTYLPRGETVTVPQWVTVDSPACSKQQ
jgi:predicted metalloprotease with PDZ domain